MVEKEEKPTHPVEVLASDYEEDLKVLRGISLLDITVFDVNRLKVLCLKYGLNDNITEENFPLVLGKLSKVILDKIEELAIKHVLERERELKPEKIPKERKIEKEKVPKSLLE